MSDNKDESKLSEIGISDSTVNGMLAVEDDDSSDVDVPPSKGALGLNITSNLTVEDREVVFNSKVEIDKQIIANHEADRDLRSYFGGKAYNVVKKTLFGWGVVLAVTAFCKLFFNVEIFSDTVLVAITSAVTLNTFAAFLGVIRGLFPSNRKYDGDENKGTAKD